MSELDKLYRATEQKDMAYLLITYGSLANAAARITELVGNEIDFSEDCEQSWISFARSTNQDGTSNNKN